MQAVTTELVRFMYGADWGLPAIGVAASDDA